MFSRCSSPGLKLNFTWGASAAGAGDPLMEPDTTGDEPTTVGFAFGIGIGSVVPGLEATGVPGIGTIGTETAAGEADGIMTGGGADVPWTGAIIGARPSAKPDGRRAIICGAAGIGGTMSRGWGGTAAGVT